MVNYPILVIFHGRGKANQSEMKKNLFVLIYILGRMGRVQNNCLLDIVKVAERYYICLTPIISLRSE